MTVQGATSRLPALVFTSIFTYIRRRFKKTLDALGG
jgi:hypothetical protein